MARDVSVVERVNRGGLIGRGESCVVFTVQSAASVTGHFGGRGFADGQVVRCAADADLRFEEATHWNTAHDRYWSRERVVIHVRGCSSRNITVGSKVVTVDGDRRAVDLVLDSELSVHEPLLCPNCVRLDLHALVCDAEELEDHLVLGDPRSDADLVGHDQSVVVVWRNVAEGDGVGLLSSSSEPKLLVTFRIVVEVLVFPGVWHEEGVVLLYRWVVSPRLNCGEPVGR